MTRARGQIARWEPERNFGFVRPDSPDDAPDIFCHITGLAGRWEPRAGDHVEFELAETERGERALRVVRLEPDGAA